MEPKISPGQFSQRVLELARRKFPLVSSELLSDFHLRLGESHVNLYNLYRSYLDAPEDFEQTALRVLSTAVRMQERGEDQLKPPWEEVRSRLFPMLYPQPDTEEWFSCVVGEPWLADLWILFVIDDGDTYWYVREDLRQHWGLSLNELKQIALQNLKAHFDEKEKREKDLMVVSRLGDAGIVMPVQPDAYNATRILSDSFQKMLLEMLGGPCWIGIPNRDFFVAFRGDEEFCRLVQEKVAHDQRCMDHPLTDRLLAISPDGVSEFSDF